MLSHTVGNKNIFGNRFLGLNRSYGVTKLGRMESEHSLKLAGMTCAGSRDILTKPWLVLAFFGLPAIAMVVVGERWRTIVWAGALVTMGTVCSANAVRCRRLHCYMTGPFFLLMALVTLLHGFGVIPLGRNGWNLISLVTLVGAIVLCCLPEMIWGKYRSVDGR